MADHGFIFDIIIVRINVPNRSLGDPNQLTVDATFQNVSLKITSSRINVLDFRSGRSLEFESQPTKLRCELENCPLKLTVKYNNEVIGTGEMIWPKTVLDKITDSLSELTHIDECELQSEGGKIGVVEVIVRLQCKCMEVGEEDFEKNPNEIKNPLDKAIHPQDVLFVVGEGEKEPGYTGAHVVDDAAPTALDLSRYRIMNGNLVQTPDFLSSCLNTDCCELKKMSNQYQKFMETLASSNQPCQPCRPCQPPPQFLECANDNKYSSSSTQESSDCKLCPCFGTQADGAFAGEKLINLCPQVSPPILQQTVFHSHRRCPVCKENVSWLPKLAACPKCGYKPVPFFEEKPYNEKLTAEQILHEFLDKRSSGTEQPNNEPTKYKNNNELNLKKECRCTCANGKTCAHCRIRKLCEDVFQSKAVENASDDCGKCEPKSSELYNICKTSSNDCRPYLARVFSELRDLYDIKETKRKGFDLNPKCERELQGENPKKSARPPNMSKSLKKQQKLRQQQHQQRHLQLSQKKELQQQHSNTDSKKKSKRRKSGGEDYDCNECTEKRSRHKSDRECPKRNIKYKTQDKCPIGHKSCIPSCPTGRKNVPRHMGWLWNAEQGLRRGWKPGAICRPIKEMMKYFLKDFPADTLRVSQYTYRHQGKGDCKEEEELVQKPTLHICKKNDEYFVTLRPLKDPEALRQCADPYLNMKPIQFRITKNPLMTEMRKLKRCLKDMGFNKCTCHKPVIECFCRSFLDKKRLEYQLNKECRKRNLPSCSDNLVLSDTTDTDVEFDFGVTPPAGIIKPERLKKPNLVNHGTQYLQSDWNVPPIFPKPPNKFMKLYNCMTGEKYGPFVKGECRKVPGFIGQGTTNYVKYAAARAKKLKGARCGPCGTTLPPPGPGVRGQGVKSDLSKFLDSVTGARGSGGSKFGSKAAKNLASEQRKKKLRALGQMPPPLLCMVDRRGKPVDPCNCYPDNRIC